MLNIDSQLHAALRKVLSGFKNANQMSNALKISHSTIQRWLNGSTKYIDANNLVRLIPYLEPFLSVKYLNDNISNKALLDIFSLARSKRLAIKEKNVIEAKYKNLFEYSPDPIFVADPETRLIVDCNKIALSVSGYSKKEILSMRADDLHAESTKKLTAHAFHNFLKYNKEISFESDLLTKKGVAIPVFIKAGKYIDENSKTLLIGFFRIISEQKKNEEALLKSELKYKTILDSVNEGIMLIDSTTHKIIDANLKASQIIGIPRGRLIGEICYKYLCQKKTGHCRITELNKEKENSEFMFVNVKGEHHKIIKNIVPITLENKKYLLLNFHIMTDRR